MTTRKNQNSTLYPTLSRHQNVENPLNPRTTPQHQQNPKSKKNTIAIVKCKSTTKNVAPNADLSYKKPPMAAGPWPSLRVLDRRLDKAFDSPEATRAFEVLRKKMEKDYAVKQLKKLVTIICILMIQTIMLVLKTYVVNTKKYVNQTNM